MKAFRANDREWGTAWRSAIRQLRHAPGYSAMIVATLSIGVAAAAAIFSVVRGVILRPLPYSAPNRLVSVQEYQPSQRRDQTTVASANLFQVAAARSFVGVTAFTYSEYVVSDDRDAERLLGARIDANWLDVLGVRVALGRGIERGDGGSNPAPVAILSDAVWRRRFGADPKAIGRSLTLDGAPVTIVGVMPPGFEFPRNASMNKDVELWLPRRPTNPMMLRRGMRDLTIVARLRPGVERDAAQNELATISDRLRQENAAINDGWRLRATSLRDTMVGGVRPTLFLLAGCVALLLLIATLNASAAALARIATRRQSLGVRLALGATPAAVGRLLFVESCVLAGVALVVALPMSAALRRLLVAAAPVAIPRQFGIAVDWLTVLFAIAVAFVAAMLTAIGPVAWLRRFDLTTFLVDATRTSAGSRRRTRALGTFVVTQLALGTVLLAATARLYANFARLNRVDPGFSADRVTTATLALGGMRYQTASARTAFTEQLLEKVRAIPGAEEAAVTSLLPMSGGLMSSTVTAPAFTIDSTHSAALRAVSDDFFSSLGIPIRRGRAIARSDAETAPLVVVVNEALERDVFAGRSALNESIVVTPPGEDSSRTFRIVGVAGNAKEKDLLGPATPIAYLSDRQASFPHTVLVVRSRTQFPGAAVRAILRDLDPALALDDVGSLSSKVRASYALQFFLLTILGAFAVAATLLIAVGVYGSVSFATAAELRSIGVRIALGASPSGILLLVLGRTGKHAAIGCGIGVATALCLPRALGASDLFGNSASDVAAGAGAVAILTLAIGAAMLPAWRASNVDPIAILRD